MSSVLSTALTTALATFPPVFNHGPGTSGGGSMTESGETLRAGAMSFVLRSDITQYEDISRSEAAAHGLSNGEFDAIESTFVETAFFAYGVTDDFQVGANIGYYAGQNFLDAEADGLGGVEVADADPRGLTDLWLTGKYRVMHGASGHLALLGGIKLPTGENDERLSNGEKLEPSSQPGTGAVDWQAGVAYSRYLTSRVTLDASVAYTLRGEHDDFTVGDRADAGVALAYRLTEDVRQFPNYSVSTELLGNWLDKDDDDGAENDSSGGTATYVSVGFRARFDEHIALTVAPAVPLTQDLNGDQVETVAKLAVVLGFSF